MMLLDGALPKAKNGAFRKNNASIRHKVKRVVKFLLCAYSSADKSTGLRNRGSWVQIPLGALSESPYFANIFYPIYPDSSRSNP